MMDIHKNSAVQLRPHFQEKEFFSGSPNAPDPHPLDERVIDAVSIIREHYNTPVIIDSTFRTESHNAWIGGAKSSQHVKAKAIDFRFKNNDVLNAYQSDILQQGALYQKLRKTGVSGFGLYDNFSHIDCRDQINDEYNGKDQWGKFSRWDNRIKKKTVSRSATLFQSLIQKMVSGIGKKPLQ